MRVLSVGLTCLDAIQVCKEFPCEDSDQRSLECRFQRGGNATNISTVLSILGAQTDYLGTLAAGPLYEYIMNDFNKYGIGTQHCKVFNDCECPFLSVIINANNGSRTIIHANRNLPEPVIADFEKVPLSNYTWIHFEGRNLMEVKKMIGAVCDYNEKGNSKITISVELEKPSMELLELVTTADVVFVGKDFSKEAGWTDMEMTLSEMQKYIKQSAIVICTWGEKGAGITSSKGTKTVSAYSPEKVVDTLGAGDTFCAAAIYSLLKNGDPEHSIEFAVKIAGMKVGIPGFEGLRNR